MPSLILLPCLRFLNVFVFASLIVPSLLCSFVVSAFKIVPSFPLCFCRFFILFPSFSLETPLLDPSMWLLIFLRCLRFLTVFVFIFASLTVPSLLCSFVISTFKLVSSFPLFLSCFVIFLPSFPPAAPVLDPVTFPLAFRPRFANFLRLALSTACFQVLFPNKHVFEYERLRSPALWRGLFNFSLILVRVLETSLAIISAPSFLEPNFAVDSLFSSSGFSLNNFLLGWKSSSIVDAFRC